MSCVPSINAYVASHQCHQDNTDNKLLSPSIAPDAVIAKRSWLGSFMQKFTFVGHDGVAIIQEDFASNNNKEEARLSGGEADILSRVRHLSDASSEGRTSPLPTLNPIKQEKKLSDNPER